MPDDEQQALLSRSDVIRFVLYVMDSGQTRPAVITHVADAKASLVDLFIFCSPAVDRLPNGGGQMFWALPGVPYDSTGKPDTWHWAQQVIGGQSDA